MVNGVGHTIMRHTTSRHELGWKIEGSWSSTIMYHGTTFRMFQLNTVTFKTVAAVYLNKFGDELIVFTDEI